MIGTRLGCWVIDRELGRGGMGHVYLAHLDSNGQAANSTWPHQAAVKVLPPEFSQDPGFLQRFDREIEALSTLDHPAIVRFFEAGVENGFFFYSMEFIDGKSLDDVVRERGKLPWHEVLDIALQVCPGLKHAHDHGIIHRDLKPHNLMRAQDGRIKLTDFGIAKVFAGKQLTATGGLVGTAEYLSPEQAAGKPVTIRSDLYSLGVVFYHLVTGRVPFKGANMIDLLHKHRYGQFDPPAAIATDMPHELDDLICKMMAKDPSDRPANCLMLQRLLEQIQRKYDRRQVATIAGIQSDTTQAENRPDDDQADEGPGPATLMSRLMRQELMRAKMGGPVARFINHPLVLIVLFLACLSLLGWLLLRGPTAEGLYAQARPLMQSDDPADWRRAQTEYLDVLDSRFPGHPYQEEIEEFRTKLTLYNDRQKALRGLKAALSRGEAYNLYRLGLSQCEKGDQESAEATFTRAIAAAAEDDRVWADQARAMLDDMAKVKKELEAKRSGR